jgi:hypothetical protein
MAKSTTPKQVTDAIAIATVVDPELAARARSLGARALDEVERVFREGHPTEKQAIIRAMLPTLMKTEKEAGEDDELEVMRTQLREVMKKAGLGKK